MPNDQFAQIAAEGIGGRMDLLEIPKPVKYHVQKCALNTHLTPTIYPHYLLKRKYPLKNNCTVHWQN